MVNLSPLGIALSMQPPQPQAAKPGIAPTDVIGAYKLATDAANTQYLAKLQQQNAMWGGLAGIGSSGLLAAPRLYSSGMLSGLLGSTGAGGAGAAIDPAAGLGGDALSALAPSTAVADAGSGALAAGAVDPALAAGADLAGLGAGADIAATAAPVAADAAASFSLADLLPFLLAA
jgi:hypothetical protein